MQALLQLMIAQEGSDVLLIGPSLRLGHHRLRHMFQRTAVGLEIDADGAAMPPTGTVLSTGVGAEICANWYCCTPRG